MPSSSHSIGQLFGFVDLLLSAVRRSWQYLLRTWVLTPLQHLIYLLILLVTGLRIVIGAVLSKANKAVYRFEQGVVFVAMVGMTFLAFNEYLQRELRPFMDETGGWLAIDGQMNMALLLMVVVGFMGASLATQEKKHIAVDAASRILSAGPARFVKRITNLIASALCFTFMKGSWEGVSTHSHDAFEGARVWEWMVNPINMLTRMLPGEKYGPGTAFKDMTVWEDVQFDKGLDFADLPVAFSYVADGDKFPLWIPIMLLVFSFGVMGLRFLSQGLSPAPSETGLKNTKTPTIGLSDLVLAGAIPGALLAMGLGWWLGLGWLIVIASVALVFLGAPLFVAVGIGTLACWLLIRNGSPEQVVEDMFEATKKQELLAIPFFVLAGNLMTRGSIARRLIAVAEASIGALPGGLGAGAVIACAIFAAISGSSPVTVIAIGSILFPMLLQQGYSERYSMGVLTSAGSLGIIIPPSIPMIVYAIIVGSNPSVGAIDPAVLFKAGILPGLLIATVFILYTFYIMWPREGLKEGTQASELPHLPTTGSESQEHYLSHLLATAFRGLPSLFLPVLILGGIYGWLDLSGLGIPFAIRFTVTEAAAVAVVYAFVVEMFWHRELKWAELPKVVSESAVMMGSLFLILVIAISLNRFFVFEQIPEQATTWMLSHVDSPWTFLIMVNLFLLALGCVMDILSAILIVAPLLAPIAASYGIHPIHFGIMFIVNLELGYLTPPMGINLFVASTVFERPILEVIRAIVPFLLLMLLCLIIIICVPSLSLALVGG